MITFSSKTDFVSLRETTASFDFYNLKNKADGARRYGYRGQVERAFNPDGTEAFRAIYQTTLNGQRYQSNKRSNWFATEAEACRALLKTVDGAMKRYAKLATDPSSKIERRV